MREGRSYHLYIWEHQGLGRLGVLPILTSNSQVIKMPNVVFKARAKWLQPMHLTPPMLMCLREGWPNSLTPDITLAPPLRKRNDQKAWPSLSSGLHRLKAGPRAYILVLVLLLTPQSAWWWPRAPQISFPCFFPPTWLVSALDVHSCLYSYH